MEGWGCRGSYNSRFSGMPSHMSSAFLLSGESRICILLKNTKNFIKKFEKKKKKKKKKSEIYPHPHPAKKESKNIGWLQYGKINSYGRHFCGIKWDGSNEHPQSVF